MNKLKSVEGGLSFNVTVLDKQLIESQILLLWLILVQEALSFGKAHFFWIYPEVFASVQS